MTTKPKVMIFCDSYLPSHTSGGGMWTVVNLIERFCDRYEFFVVTRNNDIKGDQKVYEDVETDAWNDLGNAKVFYFSRQNLTESKFSQLASEVRPDTIFLNSTLSTPTIKLLSVRRKGGLGDLPVIIAATGELSEAALSLKRVKKKLFFAYANMVDLYRGVIWKASSPTERDEIRAVIRKSCEILIAPDLTPKAILPDYDPGWKEKKRSGAVRFVFLSRLMRKKNLNFFLERLLELDAGEVTFDIVGPIEDRGYWDECLRSINKLPDNIKVHYLGAFPNREALERMVANHFFVLPTLDENFGYVFIEALAAGCPLMISDRNIWTEIENDSVGWRIPLEQPERWVAAVRRCVEMGSDEYQDFSRRAREYSLELLKQRDAEEANLRVFQRALGTIASQGEAVSI